MKQFKSFCPTHACTTPATLIKKKKVREERVTEPNTVARQLALAKAKGHGGRFNMTNGAHMTCDDLFIAVEMSECCDERADDEKKKKLALKSQDVGDKALAILQKRGLSRCSK